MKADTIFGLKSGYMQKLLSYKQRRDSLASEVRNSRSQIRLGKDTSNLFRNRDKAQQPLLDVRSFKHVLDVDTTEKCVEVEGMTPYADLAQATLTRNHLPCVVPQLKSITIGGAISGIGIESSSFKFGLVHETVSEMEVLTGNGDVVVCTPENAHSDLFFGIPDSYGTLGYVLKLKAGIIPVKAFVRLEHTRHTDSRSYFEHLRELCLSGVDFLDGVMFEPGEYFLTTGTFTDEAPYQSDYTYRRVYYKSIRDR